MHPGLFSWLHHAHPVIPAHLLQIIAHTYTLWALFSSYQAASPNDLMHVNYVLEHTTDPGQARVLRIQHTVGHARPFTFEHDWGEIARTDPPL